MQRIPEPELMNEETQAQAYANADFSEPHNHFVELFRQKFPALQVNGPVLDLGCGPADISRRFARAYPDSNIHGVDGAAAMLECGRQMNQQAGMEDRIQLIEAMLPAAQLPETTYQVIISNSLLHHLHDPDVMWNSVRQYAGPGAHVFIMDLMRPESEKMAHQMMQQYTAGEPTVLQEDFYHSLCAAFTPEEIRLQLDAMALHTLSIETTSDRHLIIYGQLT